MPLKDLFVFIIGSPRSGTTVLGEILDKHSQISQWYEPYFVWDYYFRTFAHDERAAEDAEAKVKRQIYIDFCKYKRKRKCLVLVDKSPRNSLKISFILKVFSDAHFIHILRDGRDVTLSINKEWLRRRNIVQNPYGKGKFNYREAFRVLKRFMERQPYLKDKVRALWFETHGHFLNNGKHLNRLRWNGEIGWGPRFRNWEEIYWQSSLLEFNAHQWVNCVTSIKRDWSLIDERKRLEIRYEDLITYPTDCIQGILHFLSVGNDRKFFEFIPRLKSDNFNKWKSEFTRKQLNQIHPILTPSLLEFGYARSEQWIKES